MDDLLQFQISGTEGALVAVILGATKTVKPLPLVEIRCTKHMYIYIYIQLYTIIILIYISSSITSDWEDVEK